MNTPPRFTFVASIGDDGLRLDAFLATQLTRVSDDGTPFTRARVQKLIDAGQVLLDGTKAKSSSRLKPGAVAEISIPAPRKIALEPEDIPLTVLFEDRDLIVVDKPAGLAVHAGAGRETGTLVNALLARCTTLSGIGDALRPGIVHRLDKDTTGVLVAAKSDLGHQGLAKQFHDHTIDRRYRALVWGAPPAALTVDARIARDPHDRKRFAAFPSASEQGRHAVTHVTRLEKFLIGARGGAPSSAERVTGARGGAPSSAERVIASLVECRLETGRTHQIRVHLASKGFPVVGDGLYGGSRVHPAIPKGAIRDLFAHLGRQMLHAASLGFVHPRSRKKLSFSAPLPADMAAALDAFRTLAA